MPQSINLPLGQEDFSRHRYGKNQQYKCKNYIYIPILKQLEIYLNFPDVLAAISLPKDCRRNIFSHFESGSLFIGNPLFQKFSTALQVHVYVDEAGITSDKGNRSKKQACFCVLLYWEFRTKTSIFTQVHFALKYFQKHNHETFWIKRVIASDCRRF